MATKRKSVAPFYAVAAVWLACGLLVPLYAPIHYLLVAAASGVVFLLVSALCRSGALGQAKETQTAPKQEAEPSTCLLYTSPSPRDCS